MPSTRLRESVLSVATLRLIQDWPPSLNIEALSSQFVIQRSPRLYPDNESVMAVRLPDSPIEWHPNQLPALLCAVTYRLQVFGNCHCPRAECPRARMRWFAMHLHLCCYLIPHAHSFVVRGAALQFKKWKRLCSASHGLPQRAPD